ncbi:6044_t:CDS:2 [Funneliformis mosseae]|uniref:6044_t:CDS:1 n=1 Tax=Funneliformis mosseae TaxID=27381 RepID=A0A9N8WDN8_FUNMO|nr:6044_t:CDS:2 [Funneliformis mosseae]
MVSPALHNLTVSHKKYQDIAQNIEKRFIHHKYLSDAFADSCVSELDGSINNQTSTSSTSSTSSTADLIKKKKSYANIRSSKSRRGIIICFTTSKLSPDACESKTCIKADHEPSKVRLWEGSLEDVSSEIEKEVLSNLMEYTRRDTKAAGIPDFNCHKVAIAKLDKDFTLLLPIEVKRKNI